MPINKKRVGISLIAASLWSTDFSAKQADQQTGRFE